MGIQINGQTDTISAIDGALTVSDADLPTVTNLNATGIVTASSFSGSGSNLTGIVTSIAAGSGISINQATGQVTITATGGGGGSGIVVQDEGSTVGTANTINFVGDSVSATFSGGTATVTVSETGGGTAVASIDLLEVMLFS